VFFSDSTSACYHTVDDESRFVDFAKLASQSRIAYRVTADLAEGAVAPRFVAPSAALATYGDAVTLDAIFTRAVPDLNRFPPAARRKVQRIVADVAAIVARGPDAFGASDVGVLLDAAVETLDAIGSSLTCSAQLARTAPFRVRGGGAHQGRHAIERGRPSLPRALSVFRSREDRGALVDPAVGGRVIR
jgi:hypothetical protein